MSRLLDKVRAGRRFRPGIARAIREGAGATQGDIAEELGVHRVTITRWETGARRPRGELRERYVHLLDALAEEIGHRG